MRIASISAGHRLALLAVVLCLETASLHGPYHLTGRDPSDAQAGEAFARTLQAVVSYLVAGVALFVVVSWPRRQALYQDWRRSAAKHKWRGWLALSGSIAVLILAATLAAKLTSIGYRAPLWLLIGSWWIASAAMLTALILAFAPTTYWRRFLEQEKKRLAGILWMVALIWISSIILQGSWTILADATVTLSYWFLTIFEDSVHLNFDDRSIGVGTFSVLIDQACSGLEGIGLISVFGSVFLFVFRKRLRFPQAFLLLPIGILVVWLLNSVRIALLVAIGAHLSPEMALHGFHSQAGWLMFLVVTIGIMVAAYRFPLFSPRPDANVRAADPAIRLALALLLPFAALMLGQIAIQAVPVNRYWTYGGQAVVVLAILLAFSDVYRGLISRVSWQAIVVGAVIGGIWVATDSGWTETDPIDDWIAEQSPAGAALWLTVRLLGLVLLVPIAEELAFRGYLHRALISRRFETVEVGRFSWAAFAVTTLLFGLMHSRWVSACLAGACFALLMYRFNRLSDPVAAHIAANLVIGTVAVVSGTWSLL